MSRVTRLHNGKPEKRSSRCPWSGVLRQIESSCDIADMHLLHRKSRNQTKKCSCYKLQVLHFFTFLHLGSEGADAKRLTAKQETLGSLMNPQGTWMDASENPFVHVVYWCASHMFWMCVLSVSGNLCWLCTLAHRPNAEGAKRESRNMRKFMSVFYS